RRSAAPTWAPVAAVPASGDCARWGTRREGSASGLEALEQDAGDARGGSWAAQCGWWRQGRHAGELVSDYSRQRIGLRSGSGMTLGSAPIKACSCAGVNRGIGGPASLVASAAMAAGDSAGGSGVKPPALSTVPHSLGSCAMVSGGLPTHGFAPGTVDFGASIAALFTLACQLSSSWRQPLSPDTSFWFSQPSMPGGQ